MAQSLYEGVAPSIEAPAPPTPAQLRLGAWIWAMEARHVFRPELVLLLVAPSPEYRYSYWMIVSALIAATWLATEAIAGRGPRADVIRRACRAAPPA